MSRRPRRGVLGTAGTAARHPIGTARRWVHWVVEEAGGPARFRVVALLAAVLALDGADKGTISATAANLKDAFGLDNTDIGLLLTVPSLVGMAATVPFGVLADRVRRTRLLAISIASWGLAMVAGGAATSFDSLLGTRVALGAVTAAAGPVIASLTGDFFPATERGKMYGFVLTGELVGTGIGFVVSGDLAVVSWRISFWWLALPSLLICWLIWRLPEPGRGGQSRLEIGQEEIPDESELSEKPPEEQREEEEQALHDARDGAVGQVVKRKGVKPDPALVLHEDPAKANLWWAIRYVLRVRTNPVIIVASALGYFYFSGLRGFALLFAQDHYGIGKTTASNVVVVIGIGAVAGVLAGGRLADGLLRRGVATARVIVPAIAMLTLPIVIAPAIWTTTVWLAIPLLTCGAGLLGSANPPQDAARLDIIHPHLWGRSESIRTVSRTLLEAAAPVVFGYTSDHWFGGSSGGGRGMEYTLLLFLLSVVAAGLVVLLATRTYPRDVATASASVENTMGRQDEPGPYADGKKSRDTVKQRTR